MHRVQADFFINTPLFASGNRPEGSPEIRASALKGVLRFWWRALAYMRFQDINLMRAREASLFGSTDGAASIRMNVLPIAPTWKPGKTAPDRSCIHPDFRASGMAGARYLGYGLMVAFGNRPEGPYQGQLWRPAIDEGQRFSLSLCAREEIPGEVLDALKVFGLLGGFGRRSRRGYGSVTLNALRSSAGVAPFWTAPSTPDELAVELAGLLAGCTEATDLPPFSAFSAYSRITLLSEDGDPLELLNVAGDRLVRYRSWGHDGMITTDEGRVSAEQRFLNDHDWSKKKHPYRDRNFHPARSVFGLPHNYGKYADLHVTPDGAHHDRRASPLVFHIHRFAEDRFGLIATVLKSAFLPAGEDIWAGHHAVPCNVDWGVIDGFIDGQFGMGSRSKGCDYFPSRVDLIKPRATPSLP